MEFVQFHPTGMVWPPSVRGILVTEGVRGEGRSAQQLERQSASCSRTSPDLYKTQTADNEEEGWRYTQGRPRRPPSARAADPRPRGALHRARDQGGARQPTWRRVPRHRLDQERLERRREHIKRKLPSMYHQFKELAGIDITKEPMEVGPTTHYVMGGIRVDADTQMSTVPGTVRRGECAAGLHGANRLGGNSLSDLLVFGKRAGEHAAHASLKEDSGGRIDDRSRSIAPQGLWRPSTAAATPRAPTRSNMPCRTMMQDLVGIVRNEGRDAAKGGRASASCVAGRARRSGWSATGNTTRVGIPPSICRICSPSSRPALARRLERRESRGAHFREDYPEKSEELSKVNIVVRKGRTVLDARSARSR